MFQHFKMFDRKELQNVVALISQCVLILPGTGLHEPLCPSALWKPMAIAYGRHTVWVTYWMGSRKQCGSSSMICKAPTRRLDNYNSSSVNPGPNGQRDPKWLSNADHFQHCTSNGEPATVRGLLPRSSVELFTVRLPFWSKPCLGQDSKGGITWHMASS